MIGVLSLKTKSFVFSLVGALVVDVLFCIIEVILLPDPFPDPEMSPDAPEPSPDAPEPSPDAPEPYPEPEPEP